MVISLNIVFSLALVYLLRTFEGSMEVWLLGNQHSTSSLESEHRFQGVDVVELKPEREIWITGPWIISSFYNRNGKDYKRRLYSELFL